MAQVQIAVVPFLSPAAAGDLDVVADGSGGLRDMADAVPEAVIIVSSLATDSDTVESANVRACIGWATNEVGAGSQQAHGYFSVDAATATDTARISDNARVISLANAAGTIAVGASVSAFIANGVRLTFDTVNAAAQNRRCFAVMFFGDVQAHAGIVNLGTTLNAAIDVTAPGFQPTIVFLGGSMIASAAPANNANSITNFGVSLPSGVHRGLYAGEEDAVAAGSEPKAALHDATAVPLYSVSTAALLYSVIANNFDASGFTLTVTGTPSSQRIGYLALDLGDLGIALQDFTAKTSTGAQGYTGAGFVPQAVMIGATSNTSKNALADDVTAAANWSYSAFDGFAERAVATRCAPTADPTDNATLVPPAALAIGTPTDPDATLANWQSFDADGYTLDYAASSGVATQFWSLAFEEGEAIPAAPIRVTQHVLLVPYEPFTAPQVTQHALLVAYEPPVVPRVTQEALLLACDWQPCDARRAQLWRITRTDGTVLGFTSHDEDLVYDGLTFKSCASLNASATEDTAEMQSAGNFEISGIIDDEGIAEDDLYAGIYADAYVEVFLVNWDPTADDPQIRRLSAGWMGQVSHGENGFRADVSGPGGRLEQKAVGSVVTASCRWKFGDPNTCGVDVEAMAVSATILSSAHRLTFVCDAVPGTTDAQWNQGLVRWLTGRNAGREVEVKSIDFDTGVVVLWLPAPFPPAAGDTIQLLPGCDRVKSTCILYDNLLNFGGFDKVPGQDRISKTPDAKY